MEKHEHVKVAVKVHNVSKIFGALHAVDRASLEIHSGTVHALVGPNGAGKSTLIKMIVGLSTPSHGEIDILGHNIQEQVLAAKQQFGYVSDDPSAYNYLSGYELLMLTGKLRGLDKETIIHRADELINLFPMKNIIHQPMSQYSRGNKQKVAYLCALLARPHILLIDEPIVGLDPTSISIFGKSLRTFAKEGGAVFFSTHILSFAHEYADEVSVMSHGKVVAHEKIGKQTKLENLYELAQV